MHFPDNRSLNFSFLFVFAIWISWRFPSFILAKHFLPSVYLLLTFDSSLRRNQVTHSTLAWKYSQKNMQVRCLPVLLFYRTTEWNSTKFPAIRRRRQPFPQFPIICSLVPLEIQLLVILMSIFLWKFFSWWYRYSP